MQHSAQSLSFRPASRADAEWCAALHGRVFPRGWSVEAFCQHIAERTVHATLALYLTSPVGFILCRVAAGEGEILTFAVDPAYQRHGVGRQLLTFALAEAALAGARAVFLEVAADNEAARALYAQAGFAEIGLRPGYYTGGRATPVDAVTYRRELGK